MSDYYVYRYMKGDQWIYVGKANGTLGQRIYAHSRESMFQEYLSQCRIEYSTWEHKSDMDHAEAVLIKIHKPLLNISNKNEAAFPFAESSGLLWKPYESASEKKRKQILRKMWEDCCSHIEKQLADCRHELWRLDRWYKQFLEACCFETQKMLSDELFESCCKVIDYSQEIEFAFNIENPHLPGVELSQIEKFHEYSQAGGYISDNKFFIRITKGNVAQIIRDTNPSVQVFLVNNSSYRAKEELKKLNISVEEAVSRMKKMQEKIPALEALEELLSIEDEELQEEIMEEFNESEDSRLSA